MFAKNLACEKKIKLGQANYHDITLVPTCTGLGHQSLNAGGRHGRHRVIKCGDIGNVLQNLELKLGVL